MRRSCHGSGFVGEFLSGQRGREAGCRANATSLVFYAISGSGIATRGDVTFQFGKGDFFTFPGGHAVELAADSTVKLYYVNDAPLLAQRVDWEPGMVFVTPPGYWHAHYNESGENGYVIPIQDAGLQTYLRSLDIRFAH
jgi:gentisate 1,2-dioxygenase